MDNINIENVLEFIEEKIELTEIQEAIIRGTWQGETLPEIKENYYKTYSDSYIQKEAAKLWKKLGKALELGNNLSKDNFRKKMRNKLNFGQNYNVSTISNLGHCVQFGYTVRVDQNNVNIYGEIGESSENIKKNSDTKND
ncbi:hypothetical protein [Geminocystis sp. GBBB08]|uniref:hypothetical protein n=1 Tax=Geminocystis sp. GBBB08 TaxID=2604140 RepID=UPI0027E2F6ED|nr:hypothetical protein [Geminocystis sp. GBBB08]MBL1209150.1 hypothetical protein [Geminocystis sp. GBBB08]